jgi:hypothetical protein
LAGAATGEGMAEPEEKGPLEKPIDWFSGWKASFERIRQRFGMPVAVLLAFSVAGGWVWWNWDDIARRPGVESILARFKQRALPTAPAGRLAIAVAHLERDKDQEHETLLLDELRQFEGVEAVSVDRTVDPEQPDKKKAEEEARTLLRQTGADVLIWGSVISLSGKSAMRLYWTPARDVPGAKSTEKYPTETIALPSGFWSDLKQILGLLTQSRLAALTSDQPGHYVADKLAPLIAQVRALVQSKEGVWDPETLAGVQFSLAHALELDGEQSGTNEPLAESIALYRQVLDENTRARSAPMGRDPDESRQRARKARGAGERDGTAHGGGCRLSRGLAGIYPRARAAPMGHDPEQSRRCALEAWPGGERDGAARRGRRHLSRSLAGKNPRARAAPMGHDPE